MDILWGIDYGKKLSGNTVICQKKGSEVNFFKVGINQDADQFILDHMHKHQPDVIFIDAPLSLPAAFYDPEKHDNYFFRRCDQELGAMSPMFLGGLTARAIRLKTIIEKQGIIIRETYPKALARRMGLKEQGYRQGKEHISGCIDRLEEIAHLEVDHGALQSWHHLDALLALVSAIRFEQSLGFTFGDAGEGLIYL